RGRARRVYSFPSRGPAVRSESIAYGEGTSRSGTTGRMPARPRTATFRPMTTVRLSNAAAPARGRTRFGVRTLRRLTRDAHALLAVGLVLTSLTIALVGDHDNVWRVVAISVEFLAAQAIAALAAPCLHPTTTQRLMINIARFVLAILYVSTVTGLLRTGDFRPAAVLYIPVVALAAAQGTRQAFIAGVAAIALYLLPVLSATSDTGSIDPRRAVARGGTALLLSTGPRRSISAL